MPAVSTTAYYIASVVRKLAIFRIGQACGAKTAFIVVLTSLREITQILTLTVPLIKATRIVVAFALADAIGDRNLLTAKCAGLHTGLIQQ